MYGYDEDERPALDRDAVLLTRRYAGTGIAVYKRPALLVVTFGRIRTELDLRLVQALGAPTSSARSDGP